MNESSIAQVTQFTAEELTSRAARRELTDEQRARIALAQRFMGREGWEPYWMVWATVPHFAPVDQASALRSWLEANAVELRPMGPARKQALVQLVFDAQWRTWVEFVAGQSSVAPVEVLGPRITHLQIRQQVLEITSIRQSDKAVRDQVADIIAKYHAGELRVKHVSALRRALELRGIAIEAGVSADRQRPLSNLDWYASRLVFLFENEAWNTDFSQHPHIKAAQDFLR